MDKRQQRKLVEKRTRKRQNLSIYEKEFFEMMKTKKIKLDWFEYLNHYLVPLLLSMFPAINLYFGVEKMITLKKFDLNFFLLDYFFLFFIGLVLISVFIKYDRLRLKSVKTDMSIETLHTIIKETGRELNWEVSIDYLGGRANVNSSFWKGRFSENIIILLDRENNQVLVNSITNYWEKGAGFSISRNRRNEKRLIKKIKEYEAKKS